LCYLKYMVNLMVLLNWSVHFLAVTDPSLGSISHSRCNFLSFMLIFFCVPLFFKEPHFFGKFEGVNILEQLLDFGVMG